jgi:hypothetical protein
MCVIKKSKVHALAAHDGSIYQHKKYKNKGKETMHEEQKKRGYSKPFKDSLRSKVGKGRKDKSVSTTIEDFLQNLHA